MDEDYHESTNKGPSPRPSGLNQNTHKEVMNATYSPRAEKHRRWLSGRSPITGFARRSAAAARIAVFLLLSLLVLAWGHRGLSADTSVRHRQEPNQTSGAGGVAVEGSGARAVGGTKGPMVSSLMRRSGRSYLQRMEETTGAGYGRFQGRPVIVGGDVNAYGQMVPPEARLTRSEPVPASSAQQESRGVSPPDSDRVGGANPFLEETEPPPGTFDLDRRPIASVRTNLLCSEGDMPSNEARAKFAPMGEMPEAAIVTRQWPGLLYQYEAAWLYHRPLYFEEVNLERYGYMSCDHRCNGVPAALIQPVLSGAHFFATVPALPYKMAVNRPRECVYALGHYRPGSFVPYQIHWPPLRPTAGVVEAVAATGLVFAIP